MLRTIALELLIRSSTAIASGEGEASGVGGVVFGRGKQRGAAKRQQNISVRGREDSIAAAD